MGESCTHLAHTRNPRTLPPVLQNPLEELIAQMRIQNNMMPG